MGFFTMHLFVGTTKWADVPFYHFYKGIRDSFLAAAGVATDRAEFAYTGQRAIKGSNVAVHDCTPFPTV